jgi:tetratricopeptide (TPR) repeat protein
MLTAVALLATLPGSSRADAPLSGRLEAVSDELRTRPEAAELLLERAELYRGLGDTARAAADYDEALRREPDLAAAWLGQARLWLADEPGLSLRAADRYVAAIPDDPEGRAVRSRVLVRLGRPHEAAAELRRAIDAHSRPDPSLFLELAELLAEISPDDRHAALAALDEGQARLGVLVSLQWPAIEWELDLGRPDAALTRLDSLLPWYERRETWLAARGDVLRRAGRGLEAQVAYTEAWEALAALPAARRDDPATQRLRDRLSDAMHSSGVGP